MNKLKLALIAAALVLSACESASPLRYGEKVYTPKMSAAEMAASQNDIEEIERRARAQNREEMMDTAEAIRKARGDTTLILH